MPPTGFILRQGWTRPDFSDATEVKSLCKLLETLNAEIINKLEALNTLHESSEYELHERSSRHRGLPDEVGADLAKVIAGEIARWEAEAEKLKSEIAELHFRAVAAALNFPSKRDDVLEQQPVGDIDRFDGRGNATQVKGSS